MAKLINLKIFRIFFNSSSGSSILLLGCVILSLIIANLPFGTVFEDFLNKEIGYTGNGIELRYSVLQWINDGLMAVFFLLVGLEIKREVVEGELSSARKAALPIIAASGGAVLPAVIYFLINKDTPTAAGWGIPMATDIAFALAAVAALGKRVPGSLKIFLAALAIADDLMAILVIAVFYSSGLQGAYLLMAAATLLVLVFFNRVGVKNYWAYLVPGLFVWYFIHHSGIHATIAGVLVAMTLPTTPDDTASPLEKLEHALTKPVNFLIVPLFALANTNIRFEITMLDGLTAPLGIGIILGLLAGKTIGIYLFTKLAVILKLGVLPEGAGWRHILGLGMLAGIGFTMSIFISILSFDDPALIAEAKLAVLLASVIAAVAGYVFLSYTGRKGR